MLSICHGTIGYIDPGSGAMLLQWILAGIIGSCIFLRKWIGRVIGGLVGRKKSDEVNDDLEKKN